MKGTEFNFCLYNVMYKIQNEMFYHKLTQSLVTYNTNISVGDIPMTCG